MKLQRLLLLVFDVMATIWPAIKDGKQKPVEKEARSQQKLTASNRLIPVQCKGAHTHTHTYRCKPTQICAQQAHNNNHTKQPLQQHYQT